MHATMHACACTAAWMDVYVNQAIVQWPKFIFIFSQFFPSDFFEPGVPPELVRASRKDSSVSSSPNVSINGKDSDADVPSAEEEPNEENNDIFENIRENQHLSTIQEDE